MSKKSWVKKLVLLSAIGFSAFTIGASQTQAASGTSDLISTGKKYIGTPYKFGAKSGSTSSFDCSSFTQYVFKKSGVALPRTTSAQAKVGQKVSKSKLAAGDLIFFKTNGKSISHVAIYLGKNKMLHSASSKGVSIADINSSYWKPKYVTARRVSL